jgi:hypothetical protein
MVLARVANFFTASDSKEQFVDDGREGGALAMEHVGTMQETVGEEVDLEAARPPYIHVRANKSLVQRCAFCLTADTMLSRQCYPVA